mmetsp:Transcript_42474/g.99669  ORF Transcript_42474/g.99669 Transcript_42474/m.99669 type:complete len:229 (-) Transcript_42474:759-1445(-)
MQPGASSTFLAAAVGEEHRQLEGLGTCPAAPDGESGSDHSESLVCISLEGASQYKGHEAERTCWLCSRGRGSAHARASAVHTSDGRNPTGWPSMKDAPYHAHPAVPWAQLLSSQRQRSGPRMASHRPGTAQYDTLHRLALPRPEQSLRWRGCNWYHLFGMHSHLCHQSQASYNRCHHSRARRRLYHGQTSRHPQAPWSQYFSGSCENAPPRLLQSCQPGSPLPQRQTG